MDLKGKGALTERNLLVTSYDNNVTSNNRSRYLTVMLDSRDLREGETAAKGLNMSSKKVVDKETGEVSFNNAIGYTMEQYEDMKKAAGDNIYKNDKGLEVFSIKASLTPSKSKSAYGFAINTNKPMTASEFTVDENTITNQIEAVKSAKESFVEAPAKEEVVNEEPKAKRGRPKKSAEVSEPSKEDDGPDFC